MKNKPLLILSDNSHSQSPGFAIVMLGFMAGFAYLIYTQLDSGNLLLLLSVVLLGGLGVVLINFIPDQRNTVRFYEDGIAFKLYGEKQQLNYDELLKVEIEIVAADTNNPVAFLRPGLRYFHPEEHSGLENSIKITDRENRTWESKFYIANEQRFKLLVKKIKLLKQMHSSVF